jgi:hypothetical protein
VQERLQSGAREVAEAERLARNEARKETDVARRKAKLARLKKEGEAKRRLAEAERKAEKDWLEASGAGRREAEEAATARYLDQVTKKCPECDVRITKNDGCNQ